MKLLNFKTLLMVMFMTVICANTSAQESKQNYVLNNFWDNWYISAGAGAQVYWGDGYAGAPEFLDRATITYGLSVGKWISPSFGVRLAGTYTPAATMYIPGQSMEITNVHADAMFNLSSMFGGYKPTRFYEAIVYGGAGLAVGQLSSGGSHDNAISINAGLINKMRITKHFDLNIELGGMMLPRSMDGNVNTVDDRFCDASVSAMGSITYRFGAKEFERVSAPVEKVDLTPYNKRIKELETDLSSANAKLAELNKRINELLNAKKPEAVKEIMTLPALSTFFNIGSHNLGAKELVNIGEVANFINQNKNIKYKLEGLIDYSCGSRQLNDNLCKSRVEAVYNQLVKCGVSESQLVKSTEAPASPSKNPILNRGVVISTVK